jgi:hypothetical protein
VFDKDSYARNLQVSGISYSKHIVSVIIVRARAGSVRKIKKIRKIIIELYGTAASMPK